jgi:transposase, IS30 family
LTCKSARSTLTNTHLTQYERYQIQALQRIGCSMRGTARQLCRNARTISVDTWLRVVPHLRLRLSPQQAAGRLALEGVSAPCPETIYQYILRDKAQGSDLVDCLRCQKARRKRYGSGQERRGQLKDRVCIDQRPAIVEARTRLGDWKGDTVIGRGQSGVLVSLVDRMSRYRLARELPNREAEPVSAAMIEMLRPHRKKCYTITFDKGKEFADHVFFGECLDADIYFAHPYHSWGRGTNENTNGLLRQFFPKKMSFLNLNTIEVDEAVYRLNHRPSKCLGYRTPHEVFYRLKMQPLN